VLADEINRATPRTQSSLLEAMEEFQITVDGITSILEQPFMVMATQNPLESYGTFPLPEAQIDRFFMRLSLGYMRRDQEMQTIVRRSTLDIVEALQQVVTLEESFYVRNHYQEVFVSDDIVAYIMNIIEASRRESRLITGVSTRGAIALYKATQAMAALTGREYAIPEDVRFVAPHILVHRLNIGGGVKSSRPESILQEIVDSVPVPLEEIK
jgi:MoxR-like ATPase